jgi:hypothetical protein
VRLAGRLIFRPSFPLPSTRLNIPVPPGPRAAQVEALTEIADGLGVREAKAGDMIAAERRVGCLLVEAHIFPDDLTRLFALSQIPAFDDMADAAGRWAGNVAGAA